MQMVLVTVSATVHDLVETVVMATINKQHTHHNNQPWSEEQKSQAKGNV